MNQLLEERTAELTRRVESMGRREVLVEAPQAVDYLLRQAGLPATRDNLEKLATIAEQGAEFLERQALYDKRGFFKVAGISAATILGILDMTGCAMTGTLVPTVDISRTLTKPVTEASNRRYPKLLIKNGRDSDFYEHLIRKGYFGVAGIDYAPTPSVKDTIILPSARCWVIGYWPKHKYSGIRVVVHYGLGYVGAYAHLNRSFVELGAFLERFTELGIMGDTGLWADTTHLHKTLLGPRYSKFLALPSIDVQHYPTDATVSEYAINPRLLSVLGMGNKLPYQKPEDVELDKEFELKLNTAVDYANEFLKFFPHLKPERHSPELLELERRFWFMGNYGKLTLDADIRDLYIEVSKEKPLIGKNDADRMRVKLEEIMTYAPRLTAPIKEPAIS